MVPGMVFTHIRGKSVEGWTFSEIDGEFDGPRPLEVKFNTKVPGAERLYAVEMIAEEVTEALLRRKDPEMETFDFEEPGAVFEESTAAVIWREEPSTIFFGDAGSTTVVHHDIIVSGRALSRAHGIQTSGCCTMGKIQVRSCCARQASARFAVCWWERRRRSRGRRCFERTCA